MHRYLLVDGHSMIFAWPDLRARHARDRTAARQLLVRRLQILQDADNWRVTVVFDGRKNKASEDVIPGGIQIFYSKAGQTADALIERFAAKHAGKLDLTVATEDRMEQQTVTALGAHTIDAEELLTEITRAEAAVSHEVRKLEEPRRQGRRPDGGWHNLFVNDTL